MTKRGEWNSWAEKRSARLSAPSYFHASFGQVDLIMLLLDRTPGAFLGGSCLVDLDLRLADREHVVLFLLST